MPQEQRHQTAEEAIPEWLKKAARRGVSLDAEAITAALNVDRRKAEIREQRLALERKERDALREAGFDEQADALDMASARRELEGF